MKRFLLTIPFLFLLMAVNLPAQRHSAATTAAAVTTTSTASVGWQPPLVTSWQWQLSTPVDPSQAINVQMYDIDMFDNTAATVAALHAQGRKVVCYIDVGTWENWRSDASQFPASVMGSNNGWPGEKWLDIRQISILGPIMGARLDLCKAKGYDAVEPDNIDGYSNHTGFPLSYSDQIAYNSFIADQAHARGLSVALKNDVEQVNDLLPKFDFMIDEQCFQYNECSSLVPFVQAGKAVFEVEYQGSTSSFCPQAIAMGFNSMLKHLSLDAFRQACGSPSTSSPSPSPSPLSITTTGLPNGQVGIGYSSTALGATGGTPPYSWSVSGLAPGLTLNAGTISGTPQTAGPFSEMVTVTDSASATATASFAVTIAAAAPAPAPGVSTVTLVLHGSNFTRSTVISLNGTRLTTTFVSSTQVTAVVPTGMIGTLTVN